MVEEVPERSGRINWSSRIKIILKSRFQSNSGLRGLKIGQKNPHLVKMRILNFIKISRIIFQKALPFFLLLL